MSEKNRSITELREMDAEEANSELGADEFERWQKLQDLQDDADENRLEREEENSEALDILINKDDEEIAKEIEHQGNKIKYILNMDREQENIYSKMTDLERKEGPSQGDREKYKNLLIDFFAEIVVEFNGKKIKNTDFSGKELAKQCYKKWGRLPFQNLIEEVLIGFYEEKKEKMDTVEKFR